MKHLKGIIVTNLNQDSLTQPVNPVHMIHHWGHDLTMAVLLYRLFRKGSCTLLIDRKAICLCFAMALPWKQKVNLTATQAQRCTIHFPRHAMVHVHIYSSSLLSLLYNNICRLCMHCWPSSAVVKPVPFCCLSATFNLAVSLCDSYNRHAVRDCKKQNSCFGRVRMHQGV